MTAEPITVLHLDDEPDFGDLTATFLDRTDSNFEIISAQRATDALDRLQQEPVDCVVSDFQMPGMDGLEFLRNVRSTNPRLPFILFTGRGSEEIASEAISAGADEYIQKSGSEDQFTVLANRIRNLVAKARAERDLAIKERAMAAAPIGISLADPAQEDTPIVYVNDGFRRLTGYDEADILGRNCRFLQGEDTDPETVATMRAAIDAERPVSVDVLNYRKDGTPFWNRVDISPVYDDDGELIRYVGFQRDITEEKETHRELQEVVDRISDAFFALDADWQFTYLNEQAETLLDRDRAELVGKNVWAEFPEARDQRFYEKYHEAMETQESVAFTEYYEPLDTEFEVRAYPSETGLSIYFRDASE